MTVTYRNERGVAFGVPAYVEDKNYQKLWKENYDNLVYHAEDYAWEIVDEDIASEELGTLIALWADKSNINPDDRKQKIVDRIEMLIHLWAEHTTNKLV